MTTIQEIQSRFHRRLLDIRAMDSLVCANKFTDAYAKSSDEKREQLSVILKSGTLADLRAWMRGQLAGPLMFRSGRELKRLAQEENIPRWSRMNRDELLEALKKHESSVERCGETAK